MTQTANKRRAPWTCLAAFALAIACLGPALADDASASEDAPAIDIRALWDFRDPELSEERFRAALESATGDDALILCTQIARTYVLRKEFLKARELLAALEADAEHAGTTARIRYWLERGRSYASHRHPPESRTPESMEFARNAYTRALDLATEARLDALAIDALHMFAFVDTAPAEQLEWTRRALAVVEASDQPDARAWEASIRSNIGEALYDLGRFDEALVQFQTALTLEVERDSSPQSIRDAQWHVARVLRALDRIDEALAIQLRLERESDAMDDPRRYVFEELELLYRAKRLGSRAAHYAERVRELDD